MRGHLSAFYVYLFQLMDLRLHLQVIYFDQFCQYERSIRQDGIALIHQNYTTCFDSPVHRPMNLLLITAHLRPRNCFSTYAGSIDKR